MSVLTEPPVTAAAPETLSFEEALAFARELRPRLVAEQAATEERTYPSQEIHLEFAGAGFYNLLRPKTFGGYEFTLPEFMAVMREVARGCMSTAWCLTLASGHNLQIASWWPEEVQREVFAGDGHVAAPAVGAPGGKMRKVDGGWIVDGTHKYSSGIPYATHFIGHQFSDTGKPGPPGPMNIFMARRDQLEILDDWGGTLGLKGSGSQSVCFEEVFIEDAWVLENRRQFDFDVSGGTAGLELHGTPMYGGRALGFFCNELAHLTIGGAWSALDEYEEQLVTRTTFRPPPKPRVHDGDYQRWYAQSKVRLTAAEAITTRASQLFMDYCEEAAAGGGAYTLERDQFINQLSREALTMAWKTVEDPLLKTIGSSATVNGSRMERIWRDLTMAWGHVNTILGDQIAREYTEARFGVEQ